MKKIYEKPEIELIEFELKEAITDEDGDWVPGITGSEGFEEW
jgi:hypothetical protein